MSDEEQKTIDDLKAELTPKELLFADFYLGVAHYNGTRAAKMAQYAGDANTLGSVAYKNLRKPHVKAYIDAKLSEVMSADEVLHRIAKIASVSIADVTADDRVTFDYEKAKATGAIHMVKKLKVKRLVKQKKTETTDEMRKFMAMDEIEEIETETEILHEEIEFEMHDSHTALRDLGKHHKLFTDKVDVQGDLNVADVVFFIPENGRDK